MENPVLKFLQEHEQNGYTFDEGVAVLLAYSAKANVNGFILARRDRRHLAAELGRLAHVPNLKALPGRTVPATEPKAPKPKNGENVQETGNRPETPGPGDREDEDPVTFLDLHRHETYNPEDLPTPMLKELWMKNRDDYKELQHCHQQMKQANSDAGRAEWRDRVVTLRETIRKRWELFDSEMEACKQTQPADENDGYDPFNDRSYVSKALKKAAWSDEYKVKIQRRVDSLLSHNVPITDDTLERLRERGITV